MITIWNIHKNKKITVQPCNEEVKNFLQDMAPERVAHTSNTWETDELHLKQLTAVLTAMADEGLVRQVQKGKYALTPAGRAYAKKQNF